MNRSNFFKTALASALAMSATFSLAQDWPEKNITITVPYSAGGSTDITARKLGAELEKILDQSVIIENKPGAGSTLATELFSRKKDNDYEFIMASPGHGIGKSLYSNLTYDPIEDFSFLHSGIHITNIMTVPKDSPYNSVAEFVEGAKESGNLTFSSPGVGSSIHLSAELFKKLAGIDMTHVPFQGSAKAMPAILNGDVDVVFENASSIAPHIADENVKALAVTSGETVDVFPELPTISEAGADMGLENFAAESWFGLLGHDGISDEARERMTDAIAEAVQTESFQQFVTERKAVTGSYAGEDFKEFVRQDYEKWAQVVEDNNLGN